MDKKRSREEELARLDLAIMTMIVNAKKMPSDQSLFQFDMDKVKRKFEHWYTELPLSNGSSLVKLIFKAKGGIDYGFKMLNPTRISLSWRQQVISWFDNNSNTDTVILTKDNQIFDNIYVKMNHLHKLVESGTVQLQDVKKTLSNIQEEYEKFICAKFQNKCFSIPEDISCC